MYMKQAIFIDHIAHRALAENTDHKILVK